MPARPLQMPAEVPLSPVGRSTCPQSPSRLSLKDCTCTRLTNKFMFNDVCAKQEKHSDKV